MVVGVLDHEDTDEAHSAPDQRVRRKYVVPLRNAVLAETQEALDAEEQDQHQHHIDVLEDGLGSEGLLGEVLGVRLVGDCGKGSVGHV